MGAGVILVSMPHQYDLLVCHTKQLWKCGSEGTKIDGSVWLRGKCASVPVLLFKKNEKSFQKE